MIYDIIGIGIGPFNLGLAALTHPVSKLKTLFIDEKKEFNWHDGIMLQNAKLQVPFYADLVTLADPCSPFTFLSYLKQKQRLFRFAIREDNYVLRTEYNDYCRWVASQLSNCLFGLRCEAVYYDRVNKLYKVAVKNGSSNTITVFTTRNVVIGIGSTPAFPSGIDEVNAKNNYPLMSHSSEYLKAKETILKSGSVTLVGSGQSAAEIFMDLLPYCNTFTKGLHWFSRSPRFFPMEYSKLSLEMSSPEYINHFFRLPQATKQKLLQSQNTLYKGINFDLINDIYDELYQLSIHQPSINIQLYTNSEIIGVSHSVNDCKFRVSFNNVELDTRFTHETNAIIFATGYQTVVPEFIQPVKELINWSADNKYYVTEDYTIDIHSSIFVQNAEMHTHGFNAPDLGLGPYRNTKIINAVLGYNHYHIESGSAFQTFGTPIHRNK